LQSACSSPRNEEKSAMALVLLLSGKLKEKEVHWHEDKGGGARNRSYPAMLFV